MKGIPVESRAAAVYFLHTSAPVYRVHYEDGTKGFVEAKACREEMGWKDDDGHALKVLRWENPKPDVT